MHREIMGIQIEKREDAAQKVQNLLTKHGNIIRTRLGLHDPGAVEGKHGLIIIDFAEGSDTELNALKTELESYDGVIIKSMRF